MEHRRAGRRAGALALCAAALLATGCSSTDDRPPVDGPIIQPGRPGEESEVLDEAPQVEAATANDADIAFMQMMVPHHAQALEMAELAPKAGGSRDVQVMADRIQGAQRPEILFMTGWLADRELDVPTLADIEAGRVSMDHGGAHGGSHGGGAMWMDDMAGMASDDQMAQLGRARGEAFDRLFLELMVNHHQGALEMVDDVVRDGSDQQVDELATGIAADQTAEIQRMRDLLEG